MISCWCFGDIVFQADVCHAYQLLKKGGLKDENIIVFMYDDIAYDEENPRPGVIINSPNGGDVYEGVPKVLFLGIVMVTDNLCLDKAWMAQFSSYA